MTVRNVGIRLKVDGKAEVKRDFQEFAQDGKAAGEQVTTAINQSATAVDKLGEATDRQLARYRAMAKAAQEAQTAEEHAAANRAKLDAILGLGGSGKSARESADVFTGGASTLSKGERAARLNLMRQGGDVFTTAAMGMNPGMIAIQQGPQILDALAMSGIKLTPVMVAAGGAVAALGGAIIAAGIAQDQYAKSMIQLDVAARGLGASAGMTAEQINAQAMAAADAGNISNKSAREMAATYVATGRIGQTVLGDLIALTNNYALTTRQDAAAATKELGAAFANPVKGVAELNEKLNFLSAAEERHIENLAASGRQAEAQQLLVDKLKGSLLDASDATTGWAHAFQGLGREASDAFDKVGKYIDRLMTGGDSAQRVSEARQKLAEAKAVLASEPSGTENIWGSAAWQAKQDIARWQGVIDKEYRDYVADMDRLRQSSINQRDRDRQAIVDKNDKPSVKALRDKQNELDNYLSLGGKRGDSTSKTIQADIDALKKGYASAADMANKLKEAHDKAVRSGKQADRQREADAKKAAREDEERIRLEGARADHANDNALRIAQARGDKDAIDMLERQRRLQEDINRWVREGLSLEQARVNARAQMANEMQAESDRLRQERSNPEGFVSSEDRMAAVNQSAKSIELYTWKTAFLEDLRVNTGQAFHDGLLAGAMGGNFFDVFAQRLKYAAASALADMATNALFGAKSGGTGKTALLATALKFIPGFAKGTRNAPGGLAIVGEDGPELVNLRSGAQVVNAPDTRMLLRGADRAMQTQVSQISISAPYAPTIDARGAGPNEVARLEAIMNRREAEFEGRVVATVQDALGRRFIKV